MPDADRGAGDDLHPYDRSTVVRPVAETSLATLRRVVVIEGPDTGKEFVIERDVPSRILLGTSPVCELRLTDPTVSRRHAAFQAVDLRFRLTDLGSTNGTFVDGVAIVEAFVRGGEIVRCGSTAMRLDVDAGAKPVPLSTAVRFGSMLGASVAMRRLYSLCERIAKARVPVIIEGETGTGKEILAESLHEVGGARGPFVVFDCTTVSPSLAESALFGHERGAFTGAAASHAGVFEEADGGTLFIDEIGDLDVGLQGKLLRVLDRGELRRVGGRQVIKVDVRVIAATRRDLDKAVAAGAFRDDLFHRLAVARIELPPLRERRGDVALLARHFASEMGGSPDEVAGRLHSHFADYAWPGNVRELRNMVAHQVALGDEWRTMPTSESTAPLPPGGNSLDALVGQGLPYAVARRRMLKVFERRYVDHVLALHGGNVSQAAKASGLALRYFRLVKARNLKE
jgi:two-component system response regulator HydG